MNSETQQPPPSDDTTLWALHIKGPDDVYAMPSKEAAEEHARILNGRFAGFVREPRPTATVVPWNRSAAAHAANMSIHLRAFQ